MAEPVSGRRARRAEGPRGAQPLLPARGHQAHPRRDRARRGLGGRRCVGSPSGWVCGPCAPVRRLSGFRQRAIARLVTRLVRRIAAEAGTTRLGVRVRPTSEPERIVVAYPWRGRNRARALGEAVADVIDGFGTTDVATLSRPPRSGSPRRAGTGADHDQAEGAGRRGDRHQRQDHDVADDRPHRPRGRPPRRLVEHRRHLRRRRARRGRGLLRTLGCRPGARPPGGRLRGHRDRAGRHPAQGHRA